MFYRFFKFFTFLRFYSLAYSYQQSKFLNLSLYFLKVSNLFTISTETDFDDFLGCFSWF